MDFSAVFIPSTRDLSRYSNGADGDRTDSVNATLPARHVFRFRDWTVAKGVTVSASKQYTIIYVSRKLTINGVVQSIRMTDRDGGGKSSFLVQKGGDGGGGTGMLVIIARKIVYTDATGERVLSAAGTPGGNGGNGHANDGIGNAAGQDGTVAVISGLAVAGVAPGAGGRVTDNPAGDGGVIGDAIPELAGAIFRDINSLLSGGDAAIGKDGRTETESLKFFVSPAGGGGGSGGEGNNGGILGCGGGGGASGGFAGDPAAGGTGGAQTGALSSQTGGGGGGAGGGGGILVVISEHIDDGIICTANGGPGGAGGARGADANAGGGGGGAGGPGGVCIKICPSSKTAPTANGGAGGAHGVDTGTMETPATNGGNGGNGESYDLSNSK